MEKTKHLCHRDRLAGQCCALAGLLSQEDRISKAEIGAKLNMRPRTVARWLNSFSLAVDLRVEKGIVIIQRN